MFEPVEILSKNKNITENDKKKADFIISVPLHLKKHQHQRSMGNFYFENKNYADDSAKTDCNRSAKINKDLQNFENNFSQQVTK